MLLRLLRKYVILRGMISYGVMWPAASLVEQYFVEKKRFPNFDFPSCIRNGIFGAFIMGPHLYGWIKFLDIAWPNRCSKSAIQKVLAEEVFIDPYLIVFFLYGITRMEFKSHKEAIEEVKKKFFITMYYSLIFWPGLQFLNFNYVSTNYQVVVVSLASFFWTSFLSYIKASKEPKNIFIEISSNEKCVNHNEILDGNPIL